MTNYDARKILQFMQRQVKPDSEEYEALQHAIDVLDATDGLIEALKILQERSNGTENG